MIRNLVFDLVGVIGDFGTKQIFLHFIELGAADVWELNREMDLGYLTGEEFLMQVQKRCKNTAVEELRRAYLSPMTLPVEHLEMLCNLRKKYRVFLLSNVGDMHWKHFVESVKEQGYQIEDCFDAVFPSFQTHINKPDARAFENLINATGILAEETVFFDDSAENVEAARDLGMKGEVVMPEFPNRRFRNLLYLIDSPT